VMKSALLNDWCGWLILVVTYMVVPCFGLLRRRAHLIPVIWILLTAHHAVAIANTYLFSVPLASVDARNFYRWSEIVATFNMTEHGIGSATYVNWLAWVFQWVGPSHFLAHQLSVVAFLLSCLVLIRIMDLQGEGRYAGVVLLVYGLWPAALMLTSVPMREAYQTLFFMLACYMGLKFQLLHTGKIAAVIGLCASAMLMGLLHKGLIVYAMFLIPLMILWPMPNPGCPGASRKTLKLWMAAMTLFLLVAVPVVYLSLRYEIKGLHVVTSLAKGEIVEFTMDYREVKPYEDMPRTYYNLDLDMGSPLRFAYSSAMILFYYLFSPFPNQVENRLDLLVGLEAAVRFVLLAIILARWWSLRGRARSVLTLWLVIYFSMAFIWAMGTITFGTALRHHQVQNWILIMISVPILSQGVVRRLPFCYASRCQRA